MLNASVDYSLISNGGGTQRARDNINVTDIDGARPRSLYKYEIYNKNSELLTDDVLGRKRPYKKESDPLDPTYVMKSVSGRRMVQIGEIDRNKPKILIEQVVKKDNHRHLRTEDIAGASPKVHSIKRAEEIDDSEKRYNSNRVNEQL